MRQEVLAEWHLKQMMPDFKNWSKKRREALINVVEIKHFEPGMPILEEGQTLTHAYIIVWGEVKMNMRSKLKLPTNDEKQNSVTMALQPQAGRTFKIPRTSDMKGFSGTLNA